MRMKRFAQYTAYAMVTSLLQSAVVLVQTGKGGAAGGWLDGRNTMSFLPMALAAVPYYVLQVGIAAAVVKPLFLRRLFLLSAAFLVIGQLLPVLGTDIGPKWIQWASMGLYTIASLPFAWLLPVLILALAGRRRGVPEQVPGPEGKPAVAADAAMPQGSCVAQGEASAGRRCFRDIGSGMLPRWYYWDLGLAVVPVWFGIIFDPLGLLSYLGGLINVPISLLAGVLSVMLLPAVPLCLVVLLVRMLVVWPRHIPGWRQRLLAWGTALAAIAILLVLPFVLRTRRPMDAFMSGFTNYVQRRADIPEVQAWLDTLDRGRLADPRRHAETPGGGSNLPPSLRRLKAWYRMVTLDDQGRPMIRLMWGSGMMGSWGLVIGHRELETPPSDLSRYGEYRAPIAPGAYVWREIR
jgi:hypothetical protein